MFRSFFPIFASLLMVLSTPDSSLARSTVRVDVRAAIDSFVDRQVATDGFSGAIAVAKNGQIVYQRAAGKANQASNSRMTLDTRMQIASTTKLFTQIAIRQLEQAGKLSLTDTVGKFLPNYPNAVVRCKVTIERVSGRSYHDYLKQNVFAQAGMTATSPFDR